MILATKASIPLNITADDLAPADLRSADFDWTGYTVSFIDCMEHPRFEMGYQALWDEFGDKNEMEQRPVIGQRMKWNPASPANGHALLYEMVVITHDEKLAAVRDHTAIVDLEHPDEPVTVHLSHLLITPRYRGSGLTGWMRALPIQTARECLARAQQKPRPINLVAEMEHADPASIDRQRRLAAYEKVGFLKVDPRIVNYLQPDFRTPQQIDTAGNGPQSVPLSLILRQVKREDQLTITGHEVKSIVESLYTMYGQSFRPQDMQPNLTSLADYPARDRSIDLVKPTEVR